MDVLATPSGDSPAFPLRDQDFKFDNTYARLPEQFFARLDPTPVVAPQLIKLNVDLARNLGLDAEALASPAGVAVLAGNAVATGSEPIALAYAGHQFGHFVPQLGDGRANLLGEVVAPDGLRYDIQLKGSGRTPFSRGGDGRAVLGPVLREYIVSEAMAALGVPTTRALAAVTTGERVLRESPLPGAVFTRVARSHLRVGSFQYFAARGDTAGLRVLADYALARHYPEAAHARQPYKALLDGVIARQAQLVAQWMLLGFVHGVMNTDNTSIAGETIDYGPCAFLEAYDPDTVFSSIDHAGRYAYGNQPRAAQWNLARLAEALLPLLGLEAGSQERAVAQANDALRAFEPQYETARSAGLCRKIGFSAAGEDNVALGEDLLQIMAANGADFTLTFRTLCAAAEAPEGDAGVRILFRDPTAYDRWAQAWRTQFAAGSVDRRAVADAMRLVNPAVIPRNHQVEAAIQAATLREDLRPFDELLEAVTHPFASPERAEYTQPARPEQRVTATFCGT